MLVVIHKANLAASEIAFLRTLTTEDRLVLASNGVYNAQQLRSLSCPCVAMAGDLQSRGLTHPKTIDNNELVNLQQQHQHWISL